MGISMIKKCKDFVRKISKSGLCMVTVAPLLFSFRTKLKEELFCAWTAILVGGMLLAAGFWGIAFPQYLFTKDCVKIVDKDGVDVTKQAREEKNLYCEISNAAPHQLEVRIGILEWAKDKAFKKSAEEPDG